MPDSKTPAGSVRSPADDILANTTDARRAAELEAANRALRESRDGLALALEAGQAGMWQMDVRTDEMRWTPRQFEIFGYEPGAFAPSRQRWQERVHPDDLVRVQAEIERCLRGHDQYAAEYRVIWPDGQIRWVRSTGRFAAAAGAAEGAVRYWTGITIDITERKRAEAELRQAKEEAEAASRAKDEFLATVSHELRTPLSAMLIWGRLLKSGTLDEEKRRAGLDVILRCAEDQSRLVDDLLDASRILRDKVRAEMLPVNLIDVARAAADALRPDAEAKGLDLAMDVAPALADAPVLGAASLLHRLVTNLLSNALKFTPSGGHVRVSVGAGAGAGAGVGVGVGVGVAREGAGTKLEVADDGEGIDPAFLPHLFEPFRQSDSSTKRKHAGLGLGLSIVRHIAALHGGNVEARSDGPGRGATFTVTLPAAGATGIGVEAQTQRPSAASPPAPGGRPGDRGGSEPAAPPGSPGAPATLAATMPSLDGVRVLVVEDDGPMRDALTGVLELCGATGRTAASVAEAWPLLRQWKPDLLVSDIALPGRDGYDLIRALRGLEASEGGGWTPAIALTAHAAVADRDKALASGFDRHLAKPVEPTALAHAAAALVRRRHGR